MKKLIGILVLCLVGLPSFGQQKTFSQEKCLKTGDGVTGFTKKFLANFSGVNFQCARKEVWKIACPQKLHRNSQANSSAQDQLNVYKKCKL